MQIRLTKSNTKNLKLLCEIYGKTCSDYNISPTRQGNLLLAGRLTVALTEAEKELKQSKRRKCCHD